MAEAWLKKLCGDFFEAQSAGLEPGSVNPLVAQVMQEVGIDLTGKKTQRVFDLWKSGPMFQYVITVCSEAETEGCPIFPGVTTRLHWPFPDQSKLVGTDEARLHQTRQIRDAIREKIEQWCEEVCVPDVSHSTSSHVPD
jgi:arsenate reductase